ncbi:MAG TPA: sugar ABC transporter ATP-binding protein, partial [Euzebya sp.]|nr:sugar ABC transporter ATP-binding protein [Euzebya sp.]
QRGMAVDHVEPAAPLVQVTGAAKHFGGVPALRDASLAVCRGECVGLLGENGAGKSTLVKALAGIHRLDIGEMHVDGAPYLPEGPRDAQAVGIAVIYQEPSLFPDLTIAENIFVGRQPTRRGRVDWAAMRAMTVALLDELDVPLSPDRPARGLSIADQQLVEIAKALSQQASVLIMDEPTAALASTEVARLTQVIQRLRDRGAGVVFISHKLDEVLDICGRVTIMRDGATVSDRDVVGLEIAEIIRDMVGRDLTELYPKADAQVGTPILEVEGLTRLGSFADVSLTVRTGEIVALAGLVGAGRTEVVNAIFGLDPVDAGTVRFEGRDMGTADPAERIGAGMAMVAEDRRQQGLFMPASILSNTTITILDRLRRGPVVSKRRQRRSAEEWAQRLNVKLTSIDQPVGSLSGGNQQKVVIAKWLATRPRLLIVDEPTRGIDVGTKAEVHRLISAAVAEGLGVLMVSSDLPEVLGMADRVVVMRRGRVVDVLTRQDATQEAVMVAATGATA